MNILPPIHESEHDEDNEEIVVPIETIQQDSHENIGYQSNDTVIDENNSEKIQRFVVVNELQPLARCTVLYLGSAVPSLNKLGIDSIQEPLSRRYPTDGSEFVQGVEAWLSIDENGLQIQFISDPSHLLYYPIRSLVYCASVRFVARRQTNEKNSNDWAFIPLDYAEASQIENTHNPPLFAITFQRTRSPHADECHCFVIKNAQIAVALVQACSTAYGLTDPEQDCLKVPLYFEIKNGGLNIEETDNEIHVVPAFDEEAMFDYQINNHYGGFFYKTNRMSIEVWQLWESPKHDHNRPSSRQSVKSLSLNSSRRNSHQHRRASIKSNPDSQQLSAEFQSVPIENPIQKSLDSNVIRVEPIQDINNNQKVSVQWLNDTSESIEQVLSNIKPNSDFHINLNTDHSNNQSDRELTNEMKKLVLSDDDFKNLFMIYNKYQSTINDNEEKTPKKKHKKHKHKDHEVTEKPHQEPQMKKSSKKKHRHKNHETNETSRPALISQGSSASSFSMIFPYNSSVSFHTLPSSSQSNFIYPTIPYWSM